MLERIYTSIEVNNAIDCVQVYEFLFGALPLHYGIQHGEKHIRLHIPQSFVLKLYNILTPLNIPFEITLEGHYALEKRTG